ncbi:hypothetical protein RIR_jg32127.t1 [Rhizophagus irregularis DAOM 181602=DAOM 197198]|nr:hypothetical protein RIR_jg32127.t1 [Rhizophagus irregularis DAOM 181602=DAOM 197198]
MRYITVSRTRETSGHEVGLTLSGNEKNIILSTFLKRIKSILNLPDFPKDSFTGIYSRFFLHYSTSNNRTMHQKLKNRIGVLASESDSPVRVGIISCNREFLKAMKVENRGLSISGIITKPTKPFK